MRKISNWDEIEEYAGGGESLPIGPKFCKITDVDDIQGKSYLIVYFDIASGEFAGWYDGIEKRTGRRYGFINRSYKDTALGFFKAFITAVEKSNPGYKWDWNEKSLIGKAIVVNYREEEYISKDGDVKKNVKPFEFRSIQAMKEGKVELQPKPLLLTPEELAAAKKPAAQTTSFDEIADDDLPF